MAYEPNDQIARYNSALEKQLELLQESINQNKTLNQTIREQEEAEKETLQVYEDELSAITAQYATITDINEAKARLHDLASATTALTADEVEEAKKLTKLIRTHNAYLNESIKLQQLYNKHQEEGYNIFDEWNEKLESRTKALSKGIGEIKTGVTGIAKSISDFLDPWRKANAEATAYSRTVNMTQAESEKFLTRSTKWAMDNKIGLFFNKSTDELIKMQAKYSSILGRNVQLTSEQKKDMLAMEKYLGEDAMMTLSNNLENFGLGINDTADFVKQRLDQARKYGLNAEKLTKTVTDNIKLAQQYTFRDGVVGLSRMAQKAQELKTDMSLVAGFAEQVSTVEGAIQTGAQLQVLGGQFAAGSDPLSMMYESLNDMEALFDRAVGMAKGKVFYNHTTGQMEMGAMDKMFMKQYAKAIGADYGQIMDVAFRQGSLGMIENQALANSRISGDQDLVRLVKNLATIENGHAVVDINGVTKRVSELDASDKSALEVMSKADDSATLQDMAISLRSFNEKVEGVAKHAENIQAHLGDKIGPRLDNILEKTNLTQKAAWTLVVMNIASGIVGIAKGLFGTMQGTARSGKGILNVISNKPRRLAGSGVSSPHAPAPPTGAGGGAGSSSVAQAAARRHSGLRLGQRANVAKGMLRRSAKGVGGKMGLLGGAISLGTDIVTGEFQENMGSSIAHAAALTAGSIVGGVFGPVGAMVGGALADLAVTGVEKLIGNAREKHRQRLAQGNASLAALMTGENALKGNYKKKELDAIAEALADGQLTGGELNDRLLRKMAKKGDFETISSQGYNVSGRIMEREKGGLLNGLSHKYGGMPILGSNITVEGGEFVVNKEATRKNLALLSAINNSNIEVSPNKPFGEQLSVLPQHSSSSEPMPHMGKLEIPPIQITINGKIELGGLGRNVEVGDDLLNNPQFIRSITDMISKQINIYTHEAYNKGKHKQKFI